MNRPENAGASALTWTVHPVRNRHRRTALLAAVVVGTVALLWTWTKSALWPGFALLILAVAVRQYWLPTTYTVDSHGATSRFLGVRRHKTWQQVRSVYRDRHGVLLSPFPAPSRLENFRGMYVLFNGNGDRVMEAVETFRSQAALRETPSGQNS